MKAQFNKNLKIMPKIVLYQPDIAGNVGTIIRSCVAFNCDLHIIEPCGFVFNLNKIKKSALDYLNFAKIYRHDSFEIFFNQEILKIIIDWFWLALKQVLIIAILILKKMIF
jgi:tRNA(Leu) C34 or U34 (ribose-2'-O)-methylase TrmL